IFCNNSSSTETVQNDEEHPGVCMIRDFKDLLEQQYRNWHKVGNYAKEIVVTPKHLSSTIKQLTGKTAKEWIQERLTLEAKRLLLHTDLSVKEIAYELGFEEPIYLSAFFKKQAGVSPSAFRKAHGI
ncbi:MAG: AraC family transcriptional regulator, partial [Bacteroidota bacterium]